MRRISLGFVVLLLTVGAALAASRTIWGIYFTTPWVPCGDGVLLTPGPAGTNQPGIRPCSHDSPTYPWDQCKPITIIGSDIIHEIEDQTSRSWMVVGSGHGGDGADVFAMTGGVGTTSKGMMLPPGTGIKQGPVLNNPTYDPDYAHIDVYGTCTGDGKQRGIVSIYFTGP